MDDIKFPRCGGRGLRIEWGMLPFELHERYESDPDVVIGGCVVEVDSDNDCVVTHVLRHTDAADGTDTTASSTTVNGLVLDIDEARVVRMMARAGLVPDLQFQLTGDTATG